MKKKSKTEHGHGHGHGKPCQKDEAHLVDIKEDVVVAEEDNKE